MSEDELVRRKKALVESLDQIVEPLDAILALMRNAWRGGIILLAFMALMVGVQVHTTLRMLAVEERLNDVVAAQKTLQDTATQVANKQTATEQALNQQSQITIEPSVTPEGVPTAIVVVKPPPAASQLAPIPLAVTPVQAIDASSASPLAHPAPSSRVPPPSPRAPIQFE